ncbi:classical arabinogalactan protein 4-like [Mangifera indica]|uniref:classical arabinogalactan protein 4-like n=1 Tax=Mangifera indica TaxID=29780 RepID=UPI001CFA5FF2|nr:classical arabinogalactan protein 4-like [Mangifera indica]
MARSTATPISFLLISLLFVSSMAQTPAPAPAHSSVPPSSSKTRPVAAPFPSKITPVTAPSPVVITSPAPATSPSSISSPPSEAPAPAENAAVFNRFAVAGSLTVGLFAAVLIIFSTQNILCFFVVSELFSATMAGSATALFTLMPLVFALSAMAQSPSPSPSLSRSPPLISPPPAPVSSPFKPPPASAPTPSKTPSISSPSPTTVTTSPPVPPPSSPLTPFTPSVISTPPVGAPAPSANAAVFHRFSVGGSVAAGVLAAVLVM